MIVNYLKIACRTLLKNRATSLINIAGLVIGVCGILIVGLFALEEFSYDRHFKHSERIHRLISHYTANGNSFYTAQTYASLASHVVRQVAEIEQATRILPADEGFLFSQGAAFKEKILYTDAGFTKVFDLDLLVGNKEKCLENPASIIISRTTAEKIFGTDWLQKQILGQSLLIDGQIPLNITGVFNDLPRQTHFTSNLYASLPAGNDDWLNDENKVYTYVLLREHAEVQHTSAKINFVIATLVADKTDFVGVSLQPLTTIHLFSSFQDDNANVGDITNIYALIAVAIFLLVTAIVSFANLYTASTLNRIKEVGVRKAIGARGAQLRYQFFLETFLLSAIATGVAFISIITFLPLYNELTGTNPSIDDILNLNVVLLAVAVTLVTAMLAGIYPSFYLSHLKPAEALKSIKKRTGRGVEWRATFVVVQFAVSGVMLVLSMIALRQIDFINNKSLGFDKENTIAIANPYMLGSAQKIISMKHELLAIGGVEDVSITGYTPSQRRWGASKLTFPDRDVSSIYAHPADWLMVDEGFIQTMGLKLMAGRNFSEDHDADRSAVIINEQAVFQFNLSANGRDPIGAELSIENEKGKHLENYVVVGVVKDFNFGSLHEAVKPIVMRVGYHRFEMAVKLSGTHAKAETIDAIHEVWKKHLPIIPFEYYFINERFDQLHRADVVAGTLFTIFCFANVTLSFLGLFSLVSYIVVNRTKEIGIRKLLGASMTSIVFLLGKQFLRLVTISCIIAFPVAWTLANRWLDNFAFKIGSSWWIYIVAGTGLILITALTVGYRALKAASVNPVDNLKCE